MVIQTPRTATPIIFPISKLHPSRVSADRYSTTQTPITTVPQTGKQIQRVWVILSGKYSKATIVIIPTTIQRTLIPITGVTRRPVHQAITAAPEAPAVVV